MNRKALVPAPSSVTNVVPSALRSSSRAASHRGSGGYTEMRAQIRKERGHENSQRSQHHAQSAPVRELDPPQSRKYAHTSTHNQITHLSSSISDQKISHFSASEDDPSDEQVAADKRNHLRVLPPTNFAMSSDNISNMSATSSQISSSSSTGFVRKRSQTVSTQEHPQQQQQQQQQQPQPQPQQQPTSQVIVHPSHQLYQSDHVRQEPVSTASRAGSYSDIASPPRSPEQRIGVDALQAAFSAKYYELATKCKGWEAYAAKLRAQIGVLEAEHRVLKEHNLQLERDNAKLHAYLRQEEKTRTQLQGRMSSLEDCLSQRSGSGANLGAQYHAAEMLEFDHLSLPSAPSSTEKSSQDAAVFDHTPYCSSNLQIEDRSELRPQPLPSLPNGVVTVRTTSLSRHTDVDPAHSQAIAKQTRELEALYSKDNSPRPFDDAVHSPESVQYAAYAAVNAEGRSSRLGNRPDIPVSQLAHKRSGTVGAIGMFAPRSGSVLGIHRAHLLNAQAQGQHESVDGIVRPASAQRFNGTSLESNAASTVASIVANTGVTKAALQSKRRSTVSGERGPSLSLAQIVKGALTASGVVAAGPSQSQSRQTSPNDRALTSSDYLQECVEKRREAMRSSFTAQQKGMTPASAQAGGVSRPVSRAASRLSTQSGTRSRSRAGSVHDAIPVAIEDVFCNSKTIQAHSSETSPELITQQLAAAGLNSHADITAASQRLMAATDTHSQSVMLMSRKELIATSSSPGSLAGDAPAKEQEDQDQMSFERRLYIRIQEELDVEDFAKFERYIQRYDFLDIPLEGSKGLITRVKRLLLVSDPELRTKPDKLRVRQSLARDFEKMALNFSQAKSSQPSSASREFQ